MPDSYALSADLVSSRRAEARRALSRRIETTIEALNRRWDAEWFAPLETTRGLDELSAVLRRPRHALDIVVAMNTELWPYRFRFAMAAGHLDVIGESGRASDMDGPAFHLAADALARAHSEDLPLAIEIGERDNAAVVEALARLHLTITQEWTEVVARAIRAARPLDGSRPTQSEIAAELGRTQQAVSDAHRRGHLKDLSKAEDAVRAWLDNLTVDARRTR